MAKKYSSNKNQSGEPKATAWSNMFDKLVAYAKVIDGSDWKMGWASTQMSWKGFPQNISGRAYTGGNSFYLLMATMAHNHTVPIYATFNQIQKMNEHLMDEKGRIPKEKWAEAVHVRKGEQSEIVVFNTPLYVNKDRPKDKPLSSKEYEQLSKEEKEKYNQIWANIPHVIFNIDQTNMKEVRPELYQKFIERMASDQKQTFRKDTMGMYEEPAIDYILKNQTWRCPIVFDKESKDAFYKPSSDTITVPMKEQYNIPYTEEDLKKDITKFVTPATAMKTVITDFSDADRQMQRVIDNKDNKEYLAELRATIMLENTFGKQLGILRQDGQPIDEYANQISKAITDNQDNVIAIKDNEAKIIGGQDYYTTFLHEGAHSMHKELNIELNATGDKKGYAREEMRVESSTAMVAAALGYSTNMFINSAAYIRGWNSTASINEKTEAMKRLVSDINKTVNRMGEIIDDARQKVGQEPVFSRSAAQTPEQKTANQQAEQNAEQKAAISPNPVSQSTGQKTNEQNSKQKTEPLPYSLTDTQPQISVAEPHPIQSAIGKKNEPNAAFYRHPDSQESRESVSRNNLNPSSRNTEQQANIVSVGYAATTLQPNTSHHTDKPIIQHQIEDFKIRNINGDWHLNATIDGKRMPEINITKEDVVNYKQGIIDQQALVRKAFGDITTNSHSLPDKQETVHARRR